MRALPIAKPCTESFDAMAQGASARSRSCDRCHKQVHDLSAGTEREAQALLDNQAKNSTICVRYALSSQGQLRFALAAAAAISVAACSAADQGSQSLQIGPLTSKPAAVLVDAGFDDTYMLGEIYMPEPTVAPHCNAGRPPHK